MAKQIIDIIESYEEDLELIFNRLEAAGYNWQLTQFERFESQYTREACIRAVVYDF